MAAGRAIQSFLFGVQPIDPLALSISAVITRYRLRHRSRGSPPGEPRGSIQ